MLSLIENRVFIDSSLIQYFLTTVSLPPCFPAPIHLPSGPDPLTFPIYLEKSESPRDSYQTRQNKTHSKTRLKPSHQAWTKQLSRRQSPKSREKSQSHTHSHSQESLPKEKKKANSQDTYQPGPGPDYHPGRGSVLAALVSVSRYVSCLADFNWLFSSCSPSLYDSYKPFVHLLLNDALRSEKRYLCQGLPV